MDIATPAWISMLVNRADISFFSLISMDVTSMKTPRCARLSELVSGVFVIGPSKGQTLYIGVPEGSFWNAFQKIQFVECALVENDNKLESTNLLELKYLQPFKTSKASLTRHGKHKAIYDVDLECSLFLPCDASFASVISNHMEIEFCSYESSRHSVSSFTFHNGPAIHFNRDRQIKTAEKNNRIQLTDSVER